MSEGQNGQGVDALGVFGQRFDSEGTPQGSEYQVNTVTSGHQYSPSVAAAAIGEFVVVWHGRGPSDTVGVFGRFYDSDGNRRGAEFRLNSTQSGSQTSASVGSIGSGDFVGVWTSGGDGSRAGVFGIRVQTGGENGANGAPGTGTRR